MKKISIFAIIALLALVPFAEASHPTRLWVAPTVSQITTSSASVSVPAEALKELSQEQKSELYFEYFETQQACIMIYPTPENCLPKKSSKGQSTIVLQNLKANTAYTVSYKIDNTIVCVMAPCHGNELQSDSAQFKTLGSADTFSRNLYYKSRGADVVLLQDRLRFYEYFVGPSTGYFGINTFKAVKSFQKYYMKIPPTGYVGPKTRLVLSELTIGTEEKFEGVIQSVSTACFADGECSVTIDGKKVVTTIGWSQNIVGSIKGTVNSIGDIQTSKIGSRAKVYARKLSDSSYTLYGNSAYYIEVL